MKSIFFIGLLFVCNTYIHAQDKHTEFVKANLLSASSQMTEAFIKNDLKNWVKFIHPNVLRYNTEKDILSSTQEYLEDLVKQKSTIEQMDASHIIDIVNNDFDWQAVVKQNLIIATNDKNKISSTSFYFAESTDNGKTWKFAEIKKDGSFKYLFPHASTKLYMPSKEEYLIYR